MSNARSPRDVCSTTIGTSGLMVLASFRLSGANPAYERLQRAHALDRGESSNGKTPANPVRQLASGRPELARRGLLRVVAAGGPELLARLCLLDRDRLRGVGDAVDRLALRELLAERVDAAAGAQALEQLLGRGLSAAAGRSSDSSSSSSDGLDALGLDDRGSTASRRSVALGVDSRLSAITSSSDLPAIWR